MGRHSSFRALRGAHRVQEGLHLVLKEVEADLVRQQRVVLHGASTAQGLGRSALTCAQPPPAHRSAGRRGQCFAKCPFTCQFDRLSDQFCQSLDRLSDHFAKHWPGIQQPDRLRNTGMPRLGWNAAGALLRVMPGFTRIMLGLGIVENLIEASGVPRWVQGLGGPGSRAAGGQRSWPPRARRPGT